MYAAVNETAKTISPLSVAISNGILRSINLMLKVFSIKSRSKQIEELTNTLKLEYPYESRDYVMYMAQDLFKSDDHVRS